jgi:hypothetical protein
MLQAKSCLLIVFFGKNITDLCRPAVFLNDAMCSQVDIDRHFRDSQLSKEFDNVLIYQWQ